MFHPMQITILFLRIDNLVNVDFLFEKTLFVEYYGYYRTELYSYSVPSDVIVVLGLLISPNFYKHISRVECPSLQQSGL